MSERTDVQVRSMGFCLFQSADADGLYFAVNSSHIEEIVPQRDTKDGLPSCMLRFTTHIKGFKGFVIGSRVDIHDTLMKSSKIGIQKVESETFVGTKQLRPAPLLINQTDRVVLVREMLPEEFMRAGINSPTASELFFSDTKAKIITDRPGVFAMRANAGGKVPVLKGR